MMFRETLFGKVNAVSKEAAGAALSVPSVGTATTDCDREL